MGKQTEPSEPNCHRLAPGDIGLDGLSQCGPAVSRAGGVGGLFFLGNRSEHNNNKCQQPKWDKTNDREREMKESIGRRCAGGTMRKLLEI